MYGRSHCNPYSTATNSSQVHSQTITWCCCPKCVLKCFSSPWCWWWLVFASDLFSSSLIKCEKPALIWGYLGTSLGKSGDYCDRPAYHTIPQHTVPYQTKPNHTKPNHSIIVKPTIPYHTKACHTIPYHTIPYRTIPYQKAKLSIIVNAHHTGTIQHHTTPYRTKPNHTKKQSIALLWPPTRSALEPAHFPSCQSSTLSPLPSISTT